MLESIYFYSAVIGGACLLLQLVLLLLGGEDGGDLDGDLDVDAGGSHQDSSFWMLEAISFRTVASAASFFGLTGLATTSAGLSQQVSLVLAIAAGVGALYAVYWAFRQMFRVLQTSGNELIQNALGQPGSVYVPIPARNAGLGKVHIEMQGRTVEYQALTGDESPLGTGTSVYVMDIVNSDTVRVTKAED
jgi:hypothetical protein